MITTIRIIASGKKRQLITIKKSLTEKEYEAAAISRNTGINKSDVIRAYRHIFKRKHLFEDGTVKKFDPDYFMANSWQRLRDGKNIQKHDLIMLKHEIAEEKIMGEGFDVPYEKSA